MWVKKAVNTGQKGTLSWWGGGERLVLCPAATRKTSGAVHDPAYKGGKMGSQPVHPEKKGL